MDSTTPQATPPTTGTTHYVCTGGCEGKSETPGVCTTETCAKHGQPLTECNCTDGSHAEVKSGGAAPIIAPAPTVDSTPLTPSPMPTTDIEPVPATPPAMPEPVMPETPSTPPASMPEPEKPV